MVLDVRRSPEASVSFDNNPEHSIQIRRLALLLVARLQQLDHKSLMLHTLHWRQDVCRSSCGRPTAWDPAFEQQHPKQHPTCEENAPQSTKSICCGAGYPGLYGQRTEKPQRCHSPGCKLLS